MKKLMIAILLAASALGGFAAGPAQAPALEGQVSISGAWALYPMVVKWAEEFQKLHPRVRIDVQAGGAGKGIADVIADMVDFGIRATFTPWRWRRAPCRSPSPRTPSFP